MNTWVALILQAFVIINNKECKEDAVGFAYKTDHSAIIIISSDIDLELEQIKLGDPIAFNKPPIKLWSKEQEKFYSYQETRYKNGSYIIFLNELDSTSRSVNSYIITSGNLCREEK